MATNVSASVYTGVWRDYSQDGANQLILTIPLRWGNILISGLALLVSTAGAATWRVAAFILHQVRVRRGKNRTDGRTDSDPLQRQVQTLLRNNATPISALVDALSIQRAWSGVPTPSSLTRTLLPTAFLAGFITLLFGLFSIFVSAFATRSESNVGVLARPGDACGGWEFNWSAISVSNDLPSSFESLRARMDDVLAARAYATWFYSQGKQPLAVTNTMFPVPRLPYTASMGPCPFLGEGRCLSNDTSSPNTALILDTGLLDSHLHLGINAPMKDRSNIRHRMECSPIDVSDMIQPPEESNGTTTFNISTIFRQPVFSAAFPTNPQSLSMGYTASSYWWSGATRHLDWPFWLSASTTSDISAVLIAQNSVRYTSPVYDPLFLATTPSNSSPPIYYPTHPFNLLACTQQVQFCNPVTGSCTNLTHTAQAYNESHSPSLGLSPSQKTAIERSALLLGLTDIGILGPATLGSAGILARDSVFGDTFSLDLPPDQWTRECKLWFETKLALLQAHILRFLDRIDKTSPIYTNTLIYRPVDGMGKEEREVVEGVCKNMRVVTTGQYQNFQVWGVVFVIVVCAVVIGVSVCLGTVMRMIRGWRVTSEGEMRQRARERDGIYWLLRLAMEGEGVGPWRRGGRRADQGVPVVDERWARDDSDGGYEMKTVTGYVGIKKG
ncbi:hypothetical protein B0T16DRAFT_115929 [Cercophora newfieldiana]|uniref:Uncharacterized protein n=1 Tax=Cercophora newfieldiana TaxID=92897 RepID=A0AA39Y9D1_9PEZI|nr:hypothetical protein B0T16DRAFT_115929 [Cercophora newfieldiana]